jgi:SAM-dependent methyltransferase
LTPEQDRIARQWDKKINPQVLDPQRLQYRPPTPYFHSLHQFYERCFQRLNAPFESVVEFACGSGDNLVHLALTGRGKQLYGCDFSSGAIEGGQKLAQAYGVEDKVSLVCAPWENVTATPSADLVLALACINYAADPVDLMKAARSVCRPGGLLLVSDGHVPLYPLSPRLGLLATKRPRSPFLASGDLRYHSSEAVTQSATSCGFEPVWTCYGVHLATTALMLASYGWANQTYPQAWRRRLMAMAYRSARALLVAEDFLCSRWRSGAVYATLFRRITSATGQI